MNTSNAVATHDRAITVKVEVVLKDGSRDIISEEYSSEMLMAFKGWHGFYWKRSFIEEIIDSRVMSYYPLYNESDISYVEYNFKGLTFDEEYT